MAEALLRPIEIITGTNDNFTVAGNVKTIPGGLYHNILTLLNEIEDWIQTEYANVTISITSANKIKFSKSDAGNALITAVDEPLAIILGDVNQTITVPGESSVTMAYPPTHCWFPTYQSCDRSRWLINQSETWAGATAINGRTAGISTGDDIYRREFEWMFESAANTMLTGETTSFSIGGNDYFPNQARCFEYFVQQARTAQPSAADVANPKGFYYVPHFEEYREDYAVSGWSLPATMTSYNGVTLELSCEESRYLYCHIDAPATIPAADNSLPVGQDHYTVRLPAHSAALPTFDGS